MNIFSGEKSLSMGDLLNCIRGQKCSVQSGDPEKIIYVAQKDSNFLLPFFSLFADLEKKEKEIAAEFLAKEKEITDRLDIEYTKIGKDFIEKPARLNREKKEAKEKASAENILNQLDL